MREPNNINDGQSLCEDMTVHRGIAPDVTKIAIYGDSSLPCGGIIYRHWVNKIGAEHNGWSYIGETPDEKTRLASWNKPINPRYAGKKLTEARKLYSLECWEYEVLEKVYAQTDEELKKLLHKRETFYIAKYDSYEHGFNGNRGGRGNKGVKFDEARCKQNGDNRRGKPQPCESVERGAAKRRGRTQSKETCKKKSEANSGKKRTPEMNANQSARMKGKNPAAATKAAKEWHEKNPGGWWGDGKHDMSPEMLANMKAAQQARGKRIKATQEDGTIICFPTMLDCAKHYGMGAGSIHNFVRTGNVSKVAKARFEVITDEDYQQWKSQNP